MWPRAQGKACVIPQCIRGVLDEGCPRISISRVLDIGPYFRWLSPFFFLMIVGMTCIYLNGWTSDGDRT